MKRESVIFEIMQELNHQLVVCNLGHPSQELFWIKDRPQNFYMLGSMGLASSIGLGLAMSQKEKVIVLEGDGSVLMNPGALTTLAAMDPENLLVIILDNSAYGSTGYQPTRTASGLDLASLARASGVRFVDKVEGEKVGEKVRQFLKTGRPRVLHVPVDRDHRPLAPIPLGPEDIKKRFMESIHRGGITK